MADDITLGGGLWSFLTETRVGSTTSLGRITQIVLTGLAAALMVSLVRMFF